MKRHVKVSIIVPVFNVELYLEQCIRSLVAQTESDIEIILVNDGSPDGSGQICRKYQKEDSRIIYIETENSGVGNARNVGMSKAIGEWLFLADGDDYLPLNAIEKMLTVSEEADIVVGNSYWDRDGKISNDYYCTEIDKSEKNAAMLIGNALCCFYYAQNGKFLNLASPWAKLYRREFCEQEDLKFPAVRRMQDSIFNVMAIQKVAMDRIKFTEQYAYYYRIHDNSAVNRYSPYFENIAVQILSCLTPCLWENGDIALRDIYMFKTLHLLIENIRLTSAHKDCRQTWRGKLKNVEDLCESYNMRKMYQISNKSLFTFNQRILLHFLYGGHYMIALFLFSMKGRNI